MQLSHCFTYAHTHTHTIRTLHTISLIIFLNFDVRSARRTVTVGQSDESARIQRRNAVINSDGLFFYLYFCFGFLIDKRRHITLYLQNPDVYVYVYARDMSRKPSTSSHFKNKNITHIYSPRRHLYTCTRKTMDDKSRTYRQAARVLRLVTLSLIILSRAGRVEHSCFSFLSVKSSRHG